MNWLISANSEMYDHTSSFEHFGFIDWRQGTTKFNVNDIVYIYCTKPVQKIRYKCKVDKINLTKNNIRNDFEYWLNKDEYYKSLDNMFMHLTLLEQVDLESINLKNLLDNGLLAAPQGPKKLDGLLLDYITTNFNDEKQSTFFPEVIETESEIFEGLRKTSIVNKYERSSIARAKCIEFYGATCSVCDIDFKERYGKLGSGFIHVHHIVPISNINREYKINYKTDLRPVCPNCHAMLHRKFNNAYLSIEELRKVLK